MGASSTPSSSPSPSPFSRTPVPTSRRDPSPDERERVVEMLCAQFAADALTAEDLEHRLERVYAATDRAELLALVADLPELPPELRADRPAPLLAPPGDVSYLHPGQPVVRLSGMAILGGVEAKTTAPTDESRRRRGRRARRRDD